MSHHWLCGALSAAVLLSLSPPGNATINVAGTQLNPTISAPKRCSGAFRFAARDGNSEIAPISDVQAFANDRRFARTRFNERAMFGLERERSRVNVMTLMCGR